MLKIVIFVAVLLSTVICSDECAWQGAAGTCAALAQCPALEGEVRAAGNPLPYRVVLRLQSAICGYDASGPLLCCVKSSTTFSPDKNNSSVKADTHGQSEGNDKIENNEGVLVPEANNKTTNTQTISEPSDITGHPNLSKLPTNCGMHVHKLSGVIRPALYEMPWMVALQYNSTSNTKTQCGGTLISEWYVLTAAHCVTFLSDKLKLDHVTLGEWDFRTDPDCEMKGEEMEESCAPPKKDVAVAAVIPHPGFSSVTLVDDIALIRLAEPANFTLDTMAPICLPVTRELQLDELVNKTGIVAGWGITQQGYMSPKLRSVGLRIISNLDCRRVYGRTRLQIYETQLCAGGSSEKDACSGDSGGPLFFPGVVRGAGVKQVQRGVISFGSKRCGVAGIPGVYANVAHYMDWILNNII